MLLSRRGSAAAVACLGWSRTQPLSALSTIVNIPVAQTAPPTKILLAQLGLSNDLTWTLFDLWRLHLQMAFIFVIWSKRIRSGSFFPIPYLVSCFLFSFCVCFFFPEGKGEKGKAANIALQHRFITALQQYPKSSTRGISARP